jgi:DNA-binding MarR family transcriptional regulator
LFAAAYADADDQFVIDDSDGDDLEIRRRERTIILSNAAIADETGLALAETNGSINRLAAAGLVKVKGNAKTLTFKGRVLAHVTEHGRLARSQLNALMQPAADKDVRIACRKLAADGDIYITEAVRPPASSALIAQARPLDQRVSAPSAVAPSPEGGRI